jgi:biopolymer transport protein ExbD
MSFGNNVDDDDTVMNEINMTPLVDVMLVLLIIFMLTVPVITHSVNVNLAERDATPNDIQGDTISLSLTSEAQLYWDKDLVNLAELNKRLHEAAAQHPQPGVQLRADRDLRYEEVITIMSAVQRSGIYALGFITEAE